MGRIAGQFAKPRSSPTERIDGVDLLSFRGHMVNDVAPTPAARQPDPERLVQAYHQSAATLNLLRAFTKGGFADLSRVHQWNQEFVASSPEGRRYDRVADEIDRALRFMAACGIDTESQPNLHEVDFFTSHEGLILGYEQALTRQDSLTGEWYDCSAHMLWIGERTHQLDGATSSSCEAWATLSAASSARGHAGRGRPCAPRSTPTASRAGSRSSPVWAPNGWSARRRRCSPPCATPGTRWCGRATPCTATRSPPTPAARPCDFDAVLAEIAGFFAAHWAEGTWPGGVHIELTGENVTECLGGGDGLGHADLDDRYETMCDPRLNGRQSIDLAFRVAELLDRR